MESIPLTSPTPCAHCAAPLPARKPGKRGPTPTYCSATCKAKAKHRRQYTPQPRSACRPDTWKYKPGDRLGGLVIVDRLGRMNGSQRLRCRCDCGNVSEYNLSNLLSGRTLRCADRGAHPHPLLKQGPPEDYDQAHKRVSRARGSASAFTCSCGEPAQQWAYSHADLDAQHDEDGREKGRPFSADPAYYVAMCRRCHMRFDRAARVVISHGHSLAHIARWIANQEDAA